MTRHFCTYFDKNFIGRGSAMIHSLIEHCPDVLVWVLCLDDETIEWAKRQPKNHVQRIELFEIERGDLMLQIAKGNRSKVEYYFTLQACLPHFVLTNMLDVDMVTYVDADLHFYYSPQNIFDDIGKGSIGIIEHRFPKGKEYKFKYGRFNVGWVTFRNDLTGRMTSMDWGMKAKQWCYDRVEDGKYAEQKYLDEWVKIPGCVVIQNTHANLAPWNAVDWCGKEPTFYHFSSIRRLSRNWYDPQLDFTPNKQIRKLYKDYLSMGVVQGTERGDWGHYGIRVAWRFITGRLIYARAK
jgi:hypothetical protein